VSTVTSLQAVLQYIKGCWIVPWTVTSYSKNVLAVGSSVVNILYCFFFLLKFILTVTLCYITIRDVHRKKAILILVTPFDWKVIFCTVGQGSCF